MKLDKPLPNDERRPFPAQTQQFCHQGNDGRETRDGGFDRTESHGEKNSGSRPLGSGRRPR